MKPSCFAPRLPFFTIYYRLTLDLYFEMRLAFGHVMFAWQDTNRPFGFVSLHRRAVLSMEAATAGFRRAFLFLSNALVGYRRASLFFVSGTPNYELPGAFLSFYQGALSSLGHGYGLRWVGGLLTNFTSLAQTLWRRMGVAVRQYRRPAKRDFLFAMARGVRFLDRFPDVVVLLSVAGVYRAALRETVLLRLPTIAFVDSDVGSSGVTYPIPANDDSFLGAALKLTLFKELLTRVLKRLLFADAGAYSTPLAVPYELRRTVQESAALGVATEARFCIPAHGDAAAPGPLERPASSFFRDLALRSRLAALYPGCAYRCRAAAVEAAARQRVCLRYGVASVGGALSFFGFGLLLPPRQKMAVRGAVGTSKFPRRGRAPPPTFGPVRPRRVSSIRRCHARLRLVRRVYRRGVHALRARVHRARARVLAKHRLRRFLQMRLTRQLLAWPWASELLVRKLWGRARSRCPSSPLTLGRLTIGRRFFYAPPRNRFKYPPFYHGRFSVRARWRFGLARIFPYLLLDPSGKKKQSASRRNSAAAVAQLRTGTRRPQARPAPPPVRRGGRGGPPRPSRRGGWRPPPQPTSVVPRPRLRGLRSRLRETRRLLRVLVRRYVVARLKLRRALLSSSCGLSCSAVRRALGRSARWRLRAVRSWSKAKHWWQAVRRLRMAWLVRRVGVFASRAGFGLDEGAPLRAPRWAAAALQPAVWKLVAARRVRGWAVRRARRRARRAFLKTLPSVRLRSRLLSGSFCVLRSALLVVTRSIPPASVLGESSRGFHQLERWSVLLLVRALLKLLQLRSLRARPARRASSCHPQAVLHAPFPSPLFIDTLYVNRAWRRARLPSRRLWLRDGGLGALVLGKRRRANG